MKKGIVLVIGIIFLLIGVSVVSSTGHILDDVSTSSNHLESAESPLEKISFGTTVYAYIAGGSGNPEGFYAQGPGDIWRSREWEGDGFFTGGTWTNDGRLLCSMSDNGTLYDIDPEAFDACAIGDGGVSLNSLAYDPVYEKLYGASSSDLYEINITTGEQTYIGTFDIATTMIGIACDIDGVCYGWDVLWTGSSTLFKIDLDTGEATVVGSMGQNLLYAQDGSFDYETDTLYLAAYSSEGFLAKVDKETGELINLGNFQGGAEVTVWVHSYELIYEPPVTTISFEPEELDDGNGWYNSNVIVMLNATDNTGVIYTYYRVNGGEWEIFDSPFVISEYGEYIIEYYSYDYIGYFEDIKSTYWPPPSGPNSGIPGEEYTFCIDLPNNPDCAPFYILWDWGDGITSGWLGPYGAGETVCTDHSWNESGTYEIRVKIRDNCGNEYWLAPLIIIIGSNPPDTPIIDGPSSGKPGVEYTYCINVSDLDNDTLYVLWNWGDGTGSEWSGPFESGTEVCESHVWNETGTFTISVTVRDEYGESVTAYKEVTMPRDKATNNMLLVRLLERFPLLWRVVSRLNVR